MARQICNTRGRSIKSLKRVLENKKQNKINIDENIEMWRNNLDRELSIRQINEQEIIYLEKFIARKEGKPNVGKS